MSKIPVQIGELRLASKGETEEHFYRMFCRHPVGCTSTLGVSLRAVLSSLCADEIRMRAPGTRPLLLAGGDASLRCGFDGTSCRFM